MIYSDDNSVAMFSKELRMRQEIYFYTDQCSSIS